VKAVPVSERAVRSGIDETMRETMGFMAAFIFAPPLIIASPA
jgi:hypothetical protein